MSAKRCYVKGCERNAAWIAHDDEDGDMDSCAEHAGYDDWETLQAEWDARSWRRAMVEGAAADTAARWEIVDRRTGAVMGINTYPSPAAAWHQITMWQNRHDRGGRPDITRDMLLNMEPRPRDSEAT